MHRPGAVLFQGIFFLGVRVSGPDAKVMSPNNRNQSDVQIKTIFFASLREQIGNPGAELDLDDGATVSDVWQAVSPPGLEIKVLCAVNEEYVDFSHVLKAGDEVAFFPPVTGG